MKHIGRLALFLCLAVNAFFIGMLLLTAYSPYINPEVHPVQSCLGLTFPIFLVINFCFLIFWLIVRYRFALVPPLLSAVAHLYACQPGNGRTTGKQHQTPFVQHHVLWEHEERERTKPHPELYKKQQRRHRLHAGVCRLRNRQDTSQQ
jgi:hypothetical protein